MANEDKLQLAKEALASGSYDKETIEYIFPELRESKDEKIREELYRYFRDLQLSSDREFSPSISIDEILAWLEKPCSSIEEIELNSLAFLPKLGYTCIPPKKEEELTEFEKAVENILNYPHFQDEQAVKQISKTLLDLARKELLKSLPKWKKAKKDEELDCHVAIQQDGRVVLSDFVQKDEYYITLDVLKKLQKEE